ncbi:MAG: Dabb family protein [Eubacterium sp.]|jgi:hypothetical protein|nr:Dabb family protein [Eubacterium sp.]
MIINNLLLRLKERDSEGILKARDTLLSMKGKIGVLVDLQAEVNIRAGGSAYDIILITKFSSMEDLDAYLVHPVHVEAAKYIGSVVDIQAAVCYRI